MGTLKIADAHQKLINDLSTGKFESFFEKLYPFLFGQRMMALDPRGEATMAVSNRDDLLCIVNSGFNFIAVPDDGCVL